jgi:hypothetical protein
MKPDILTDLCSQASSSAFFALNFSAVMIRFSCNPVRRSIRGKISSADKAGAMPEEGAQARLRVLCDDPRIKADRAIRPCSTAVCCINSPAIPPSGQRRRWRHSPDSATLYFAPLASRRLYSISTALLADFTKDDATLAASIHDEGEKGAADGLATDPWGRIYTTAADHDAVFRRDKDGHFDLIARDPRFVWPDGIFADGRYVYVVLGQWTRLPLFHDGQDLRKPPFLVARMAITAP